jgi:methylenetetrahydrofolate reductase (NADPH)
MKVSFEFFPPRTEAMEARLWDAIIALESMRPAFVSVTYGAGGSTRERTHSTVRRILHETDLTTRNIRFGPTVMVVRPN